MNWKSDLKILDNIYLRITMILRNKPHLLEIIRECKKTYEIDKRTMLLQYLNNLLPSENKIQLPYLITNNWINNYLYSLEEKFP